MSPRIVDKKKKKREILLAAMMVFAQKGVKNSRMADIALQAKIGKGTIYEYFRSRDQILIEAFDLVMGDMEVRLKSSLQSIQNPEERLSSIMRITYDTLSELSADVIQIFLDFWSEGIRQKENGKGLEINLKEIYIKYRRLLNQVLKDGIKKRIFRKMDTTVVASTLMAIIDGLLLQLILDKKALGHPQVIEEALDMVLNGIKCRSE